MNSQKILQGLVFFFTSLLGFVLLFQFLVPSAQPVLTQSDYQTKEVENFYYVALGDSLTEGVGDTTLFPPRADLVTLLSTPRALVGPMALVRPPMPMESRR